MLSQPFVGAGYLLRGLTLITLPGLRRFVVVPLLINIILFGLAIYYGVQQLGVFIEWLLPQWLDWLRWLLWPVFALAVLLVVFYTFTLLANLIGAPFNGLLALAVEQHLTGQQPRQDISWKALLTGAVPMMLSELRKLLYFVLWTVPFLLLFVVPLVQIAAPFLWLVFSAWMLAVEYADYPASNQNLPFAELRVRLRRRKFMSLGFGTATMVTTLIPIVNFLVMPAAVAGATAMWLERYADPAGTKK